MAPSPYSEPGPGTALWLVGEGARDAVLGSYDGVSHGGPGLGTEGSKEGFQEHSFAGQSSKWKRVKAPCPGEHRCPLSAQGHGGCEWQEVMPVFRRVTVT